MQDATLVFLLKGNPVSEVLLGFKKIGFGQGKYTGFGGKVEPGETVAEAALRELTEETGVTVPSPETLNYAAILEFRFPHKPDWEQRVFVFLTHHWEGSPAESNEMIPNGSPSKISPTTRCGMMQVIGCHGFYRGRDFGRASHSRRIIKQLKT